MYFTRINNFKNQYDITLADIHLNEFNVIICDDFYHQPLEISDALQELFNSLSCREPSSVDYSDYNLDTENGTTKEIKSLEINIDGVLHEMKLQTLTYWEDGDGESRVEDMEILGVY